jgi:hypothetical protein
VSGATGADLDVIVSISLGSETVVSMSALSKKRSQNSSGLGGMVDVLCE